MHTKKIILVVLVMLLVAILIGAIKEYPVIGFVLGFVGLILLTSNRKALSIGWAVIGVGTIICIGLAIFGHPTTDTVQAKEVDLSISSVAVITPAPTPKAVEKSPPKVKSKCVLDPSWSDLPQVYRWKKLIIAACEDTSIESNLLAALIYTESKGDPQVISNAGAVGLTQVMPCDGLARTMYGSMFASRPTTKQLLKPRFNIRYGSRFLAQKIADYGNIYDALYAYNGGHPDYVPLVMQAYNDHLTQN